MLNVLHLPFLFMLSLARVFGILHYLEDNFFSVREGKDKASSQSSATKEAEHRMGKVDIGGCRIEVDDIRQVVMSNGPTAIEYRKIPKFGHVL